MSRNVYSLCCVLSCMCSCFAQTQYKPIQVSGGGRIAGTVKWSGPALRPSEFPINKDPEACDEGSKKTVSLDRLIVGPEGGVADTVVFLKDITAGKPLTAPEERRHLDQKHCRYIPHILLVPQDSTVEIRNSDPTLHTVHMDGAATFNLPFPPGSQPISRNMNTSGLVHLRCNAGHVWMNAEMMVISHPYYAVTDESGQFELTNVPAGTYEIVAWHEGWGITGQKDTYFISTNSSLKVPVFTEPKTWQKTVTVKADQRTVVDFTIGN